MNQDSALLKQQYKELYTKVEEILFRQDLMGINFEDNMDEYDPEVDTILPRLKDAQSKNEILDIVHEELVRWFDADMVGKKTHPVYKTIASEIWEVWLTYSGC